MVKRTQTICWQQPTNCLSAFDHFLGSGLKGLIMTVFFFSPNQSIPSITKCFFLFKDVTDNGITNQAYVSPNSKRKHRDEFQENLGNHETDHVGKKDILIGEGVECFLTSIEKSSFGVHRFNNPEDVIIEVDKKSFTDHNIAPLDNVLSNYLGELEK